MLLSSLLCPPPSRPPEISIPRSDGRPASGVGTEDWPVCSQPSREVTWLGACLSLQRAAQGCSPGWTGVVVGGATREQVCLQRGLVHCVATAETTAARGPLAVLQAMSACTRTFLGVPVVWIQKRCLRDPETDSWAPGRSARTLGDDETRCSGTADVLWSSRLKMDEWKARLQVLLREVKESNPRLTVESAPGSTAPSCCRFFFSTA